MKTGLLMRVRKYLDTPYLVSDQQILARIKEAKTALGPRQVDKHDKWTARIVRYAVHAVQLDETRGIWPPVKGLPR